MLHYYDINYDLGADWYQGFFRHGKTDCVNCDTTVTYARSEVAVRRIANDDPKAKFLLSLRNPAERAYSHYWHEKGKKRIAYEFREWACNYDLFQSWVETGLYSRHIERIIEIFGKERVLVTTVDEISRDAQAVLDKIFGFAGVDSSFRPTALYKRQNSAVKRAALFQRQPITRTRLGRALIRLMGIRELGAKSSEYEKGMNVVARERLEQIFAEDIRRLSVLLDRDFSDWTVHDY
jgi:hypothetical protein